MKETHTMTTLKGRKITVHDMTLRDGMHPKRHLMTLEQMKSVAEGLDAAGVPLIEVTHGDGLGGASAWFSVIPAPKR
jgi:4-hydroxy-2-oxovalerate/4-hydroxy-2-oxohexanoate aldolase